MITSNGADALGYAYVWLPKISSDAGANIAMGLLFGGLSNLLKLLGGFLVGLFRSCVARFRISFSRRSRRDSHFCQVRTTWRANHCRPSTVATDAVVGVVAPQHCGQIAVLLADGAVSVSPTPIVSCGWHGDSWFGPM
jgi:hypothetical protein